MKLTDRFTDEVEYQGNALKLNLSFDNVLRVLELLDDDLFSKIEKMFILLEMLVKNANDLKLSFGEVNQIIGFLFDQILFPKKEDGKKEESHFDFNQDAAYIYASFLQDYNMDLFEMQGKLHWRKFLALLESLSDETKFKEVIGIRAQQIPAPTKYNQKERKRLIELKRIYKLKSQKPSLEDADAFMTAYSNALKKSYKKGR